MVLATFSFPKQGNWNNHLWGNPSFKVLPSELEAPGITDKMVLWVIRSLCVTLVMGSWGISNYALSFWEQDGWLKTWRGGNQDVKPAVGLPTCVVPRLTHIGFRTCWNDEPLCPLAGAWIAQCIEYHALRMVCSVPFDIMGSPSLTKWVGGWKNSPSWRTCDCDIFESRFCIFGVNTQ